MGDLFEQLIARSDVHPGTPVVPSPRLFRATGRRLTSKAEWVDVTVKSVLNQVKGMPFRWSINPYRGCSNACPFCYARLTHWYLDEDGVNEWSTKVFVKVNAAELLRHELGRRSWKRELVALGTATDPYQPAERHYGLTRRILEALRDFSTPASIVTRSPLILRDIDVLQDLARRAEVTVCVSVATTDEALARQIEPNVATPAKRLRAMKRLSAAGVRAGVMLAPILPGLTDSCESLEAVVRAARDHDAHFVGHNVLFLGDVTKDAFMRFLNERHPDLIPLYRRLYRRKYAPAAYQDAVSRTVAKHKDRLRMQRSRYAESAKTTSPSGRSGSVESGPSADPKQLQLL